MLTSIDKNLFVVESEHKGRLPYCYCLYIDGGTRGIIDTSCGMDNIGEINRRGIDWIVNTHFHEDHILLNNQLTGAEVWVHQLDADGMLTMDGFNKFYGFPQHGEEQLGWDFIASVGLEASPVHHHLENGQILDFGSTACRVVHTPGHTPGHCCFYFEKEGLLCAGDIDLTGFGPWYGNVCGDVTDYIESIRKCMELKPRLVLSSHKGLIDNDLENRFVRYLDVVFQREDKIIAALAEPQSLDQLTALKIVYGINTNMDDLLWFMEKVSMEVHLKRLMELGQVKFEDGMYYLA